MSTSVSSRLTTDTQFISDLVAGVKRGEIKVPQFQRKFVWAETQAIDLIDSITNNYPVGSLLLWRTPNKLAIERNIGEFKLPDTDDMTPTDYVLDGQQRLTVIFSCFGASRAAGGFEVFYDLENDSFKANPSTQYQTHFPLRWIYDTTNLLNFRSGLVAHPRGTMLQLKLDKLIDSVTKYKIPVVLLKDLSVEQVCPIFERINSSGTRLSVYDLMVAATWSQTFDLNSEADKIKQSLFPKGFDDIDNNTVLKCLSAINYRDIKKNSVLSLRKIDKAQMDELVTKTGKSLLQVVDLLKTEFNIYSWDFLPYEAYAVILSVIFSDKTSLNVDQVRRVRQWFWKSSFTERYRGASEHYISKDISNVESFILDGDESKVGFSNTPSKESLVGTQFRSNNSKSRAFVVLLSMLSPHNLTNGLKVDTENALSSYNKKQFHHIYPKAHLRGGEDESETNSIVNICVLAASENNFISDTDPNIYLPRLKQENNSNATNIFRSNLLPDPNLNDYSTMSYSNFLQLRSGLLHAAIEKLCGGDRL